MDDLENGVQDGGNATTSNDTTIDEKVNTDSEANANEESEQDLPLNEWDIRSFDENEAIVMEDGKKISFKQLKEIIKGQNNVQNQQSQSDENLTKNNKIQDKTVKNRLEVQMAGILLDQLYEKFSSKYPLVDKELLFDELKKHPDPDFTLVEPLMQKLNAKIEKLIEKKQALKQKTNNPIQFAGENKQVKPATGSPLKNLTIDNVEEIAKSITQYLDEKNREI